MLVLSLLIIIASILLVAVIFVQNPKGGGLSTDFGSAHQLGGVQKTNDLIDKATWGLAGIIAVLSIVMTLQSTPDKEIAPEPETVEQTEAGNTLPADPAE